MKLWWAALSLAACGMSPVEHREQYHVQNNVEDINKQKPNIVLYGMSFINVSYHQEHFQDTNEWVYIEVDKYNKDIFLERNLPISWVSNSDGALMLECSEEEIKDEICIKKNDIIDKSMSFEGPNFEIQYAISERKNGNFRIWMFKAVR